MEQTLIDIKRADDPSPTRSSGWRPGGDQDAVLVSRLRAGDPAAFERIYDRHSGKLFSLCMQMLGNHAEAEDALQQTFLDAYRSMRGNGNDLALGPWLYRIARNECLQRIRARRDPAATDGASKLPSRSVAAQAEQREELAELLRDMKRLPEEQSTALTLSAFGDLSHAEIGGVLGCEPSKVKSLVFRGHRSLLASRAARAMECVEVRKLLDTLNGGSLRRIEIRDHIRDCNGCHEHRSRARKELAPSPG